MNPRLLTAAAAIAAAALAGCSASTAAPAAVSPSAEHIATAMGVTRYTAYNARTDPNQLLGRQGEYTSKVNWGAGGDGGDNSIEVFPTAAGAKGREAYVKLFRCPFGDGYDHVHGTALLRLACSLTPAQAKADEAAFDKAAG